MFWQEYFLVILLSIASLVLKIRLYILYKMFILIVFNLIEHKNKPEHLPINKKCKALLLVNCRYLLIFIFISLILI